ncbi:MAG: hypothetical protein WC307_04330 [Candidatus Nanoarchaeia archaeon]
MRRDQKVIERLNNKRNNNQNVVSSADKARQRAEEVRQKRLAQIRKKFRN